MILFKKTKKFSFKRKFHKSLMIMKTICLFAFICLSEISVSMNTLDNNSGNIPMKNEPAVELSQQAIVVTGTVKDAN